MFVLQRYQKLQNVSQESNVISSLHSSLLKKMNAITVILLIGTFTASQSLKILGVFPVTARSHYILGNALMKGLAEQGHDVTLISSFEDKKPPKKGSYRNIVLTGFKEKHEERRKDINMFEMADKNIFVMVPFFLNMMLEMSEYTLNNTNVQQLLESKEQFDVVIVEQFMNEAHKGFATHFNAPLVLFSTIGANTWVNMLVGNPSPLSYIPDIFLTYSSQMTLWQKTVNTLFYVYCQGLYHFHFFPKQEQLYNKFFPTSPNFYDTLYNGSIVLMNSHTSINQPVPFVPSMIEIGGYHVQPSKQLPEDIKQYLDEAKDGVIYFSMGSNLRSMDLPPEKRDSFLKTFSKLKQKILWKFEDDILPGQPQNVKLAKWLPQQDILAHPNVKVFITHGGLLSTTETIYHGVPVLAIPIAGDQKLNANKIVNEGFGLLLYYKDITEQTLTEKLTELLENPKYSQNAKKRSQLFHDRIVNPMDTATYWVEYVARHGGAPHLRVAGVDLPWYKYLLLDVIAFIALASLVGVYVFCKVTKMLCKSLCSKSKAKKVKKS